MGTEKGEMIPYSTRCFLIFSWSEGTFGEWQMLGWPVSLRFIHQISFLVTHTGLSPAPPQTSSPADPVVRDLARYQHWQKASIHQGFTMTGPCGFPQRSVSMSKLTIKDVHFGNFYVYIPAGKGMLHYLFSASCQETLNVTLTKPYLKNWKFKGYTDKENDSYEL